MKQKSKFFKLKFLELSMSERIDEELKYSHKLKEKVKSKLIKK